MAVDVSRQKKTWPKQSVFLKENFALLEMLYAPVTISLNILFLKKTTRKKPDGS